MYVFYLSSLLFPNLDKKYEKLCECRRLFLSCVYFVGVADAYHLSTIPLAGEIVEMNHTFYSAGRHYPWVVFRYHILFMTNYRRHVMKSSTIILRNYRRKVNLPSENSERQFTHTRLTPIPHITLNNSSNIYTDTISHLHHNYCLSVVISS